MLINADQRGWIAATLAFTAVATAAYVLYASAAPHGPSGGSWAGLFFGILGAIFMIAAALLAARKKVRTWRIGSAQAWMRAHIWLGLLAVPCIWFHSGFGFGGALTTILMILFYIVIASGIVGLLLQQFVPAAMARRLPLETVRGQIDHVLDGLAADAYELVAGVTGPLAEAEAERAWLAREEEIVKQQPGYWKQVARQRPAESPAPDSRELRKLYLNEVRPFLEARRGARAVPDLRPLLLGAPQEWRARVERLQGICEEARQLALQRRMHGWLHGWLLVHAPLSFALLVLAAFHAVFALRY